MGLWTKISSVFRSRPSQTRVYLPQAQAGIRVTEDTALTMTTFWACVRVISQTLAALHWGVFERLPEGRKPARPAVSWLLNHRPNPEMTAVAFREALMAHVLTWGNGYAEILFDMAGNPSQLWLIAPDRVFPERNEATGELQYRVMYESGEQVLLPPERVFHVHGLGFDGVMGYSPVRMAARALGVGIAQETFAQSFYANGAVFGTIVEYPVKNMSVEQIAAAEADLNGRNRGPAKAFTTKVVPEGVKTHTLSMPLEDAQFLESRKFSVVEVCRLFGVQPHKVADLDRSTNNNIEHQGIEFVVDTIVPWAVRLEQEADVKLFSARAQGRVYTKIAVAGLMRGDSKARAEYYRTMVNMGAMTINEVRALEDMNGIGPAGDVHLVQLNQTTLEFLVANPGAKSAPAAAEAPGTASEESESEETEGDDPPGPTNVIRATALAWAREQRKQS